MVVSILLNFGGVAPSCSAKTMKELEIENMELWQEAKLAREKEVAAGKERNDMVTDNLNRVESDNKGLSQKQNELEIKIREANEKAEKAIKDAEAADKRLKEEQAAK